MAGVTRVVIQMVDDDGKHHQLTLDHKTIGALRAKEGKGAGPASIYFSHRDADAAYKAIGSGPGLPPVQKSMVVLDTGSYKSVIPVTPIAASTDQPFSEYLVIHDGLCDWF